VQLADALAEPANIDGALAGLRADELLALRASYLVADGSATFAALQTGFERSGGSGEMPLERLVELGLVVGNGPDRHSSFSFKVPRAVAARSPSWSEFAHGAQGVTPELPGAGVSGLGMLELLIILAQALSDGLPERPPSTGAAARAGTLPTGWGVDPLDVAADEPQTLSSAIESRGREVALVPVALLRDEDLAQLAVQTGQSTAAIDFGLHLLLHLGLVRRRRGLRLQQECWRAFEAATAEDRLALLCRAWLEMTDWSELTLGAGSNGPLQLRGRLGGQVGRVPLLFGYEAALRRLGARCLGLLEPNVWYGTASLIATIDSLAPATLPERSIDYWSRETLDKLTWWLIDRRPGHRALALSKPEGRARVHGILLAALLKGPLAWLGLVDVVAGRDGLRAFRVRPTAGVLVGRPIDRPAATLGTVIVGEDGSVLAPAGMVDPVVQGLLRRVGELVGGSAEGLRYRLSAERVQTAFDEGLSGPELLSLLEERSSKPLPGRVRSMLERWWASYGSVRLYDELTLVELSEEVLPAEVLAAVPALRQHLVHALAPRLLVVEALAADAVIGELVRLGYAPKVERAGAVK
jgi:hypothetical protein